VDEILEADILTRVASVIETEAQYTRKSALQLRTNVGNTRAGKTTAWHLKPGVRVHLPCVWLSHLAHCCSSPYALLPLCIPFL
jgi:hypothetical protein